MGKTLQTRLGEQIEVLDSKDSLDFRPLDGNKDGEVTTDNSFLNDLGQNIYNNLMKRKRKKPTEPINIIIEFYPYTNLKLTLRKRDNKLMIRLSDILIEAPIEVLKAGVIIILSQYLNLKLSKETRELYRNYIYCEKMRNKKQRMRQRRAKKHINGSKGKYFDLEEIFQSVNDEYFNGNIKKPVLTWSANTSIRRLGHFDPDLNILVVSKRLDSAKTPTFVINYIVFHELLHNKYPGQYLAGKWIVHNKDFKEAEKNFLKFAQVKKWLKDKK